MLQSNQGSDEQLVDIIKQFQPVTDKAALLVIQAGSDYWIRNMARMVPAYG
jgi:hypothetical protein